MTPGGKGGNMNSSIFSLLTVIALAACCMFSCTRKVSQDPFIFTTTNIPIEDYPKVRYLQLYSGNGLQSNKESAAIGKFPNLKSLTIMNDSGLKTPELLDGLKALTNLTYLSLPQCRIDSITDDFSYLNQISTLDLSNNRISSISCELFKLPLKKLYLSDNQIEKLPECGVFNDSITSFALNENYHLDISGAITLCRKFRNLEYLNISNCRISEMPRSIGQLRSLKTLNIGFNNLRKLPLELTNLPHLENLWIISSGLSKSYSDSLKFALPQCKIIATEKEAL